MGNNERAEKKKKKKAHTVPKSYLKNFADPEGKIWILDRSDKIYSVNPSKVLTGNYYYVVKFDTGGGTLKVEETLAEIESKFASIFKQKIERKLSMTLKEKAFVSLFVAALLFRTESHRKNFENFIDKLTNRYEQMMKLPDKVKNQLAQLPIAKGEGGFSGKELVKASKEKGSLHSQILYDLIPELAEIIFRMRWNFLQPEQEKDLFITSDNPCATVNPVTEKKYGVGTFSGSPGLAQQDVEVSLPLSPKIAFLAGWKSDAEVYDKIPTRLVNQINYRSYRQWRTKIISATKQGLEELNKKITELKTKKQPYA